MSSQDDKPLSIESLFSEFMKRKPEEVAKIYMMLDWEISRVVKNWRNFAEEFKVAAGVVEKLRWYGTFSPTANIFDNLESTKPDLTIETLKLVFEDIKRNDLKDLLNGVDNKAYVHTALNESLLRKIALGLDRFKGATANWEDFASHKSIGIVAKGELHQFGTPLLDNPTAKLFQYLETNKPQLKLGELYDVLSSDAVKRVNTANRLRDARVEESSWRGGLVKDVIVPESELLRKICNDLNREVIGTGGWRNVAAKLGIPHNVYREFQKPREKQSPTEEVLKRVIADQPHTTILQIVLALVKIERNDVVQVIGEFLGIEDIDGFIKNLRETRPDEGVEDSIRSMTNLRVRMPDEADAAAKLSGSSGSTGPPARPSGSTEPPIATSAVPSGVSSGSSFPSPPQVFLSYNWAIQRKVEQLKKRLEQEGITCWMDTHEGGPGDKLREIISYGITNCKVFISCLTKEYCNSDMCRREATLACERKKHIIPLRFEDLGSWPPQGSLAMVFTDTLYLKLPDGMLTDREFEKLLRKMKEVVYSQNE